jgi:hypothetical protein
MWDDFPDDADGDALRRLRNNGSDMSQPHKIDFYLTFKDRTAAAAVEERIILLGIDVTVNQRATDGRWACDCQKSIVPTHEDIVRFDRRLKNLCEEFGGTYEGWGTMSL